MSDEPKIAVVESHGPDYNGIGDSEANSVSYVGGQGYFFCSDPDTNSAGPTNTAALDAALEAGVPGINADNHDDAAAEIIANAFQTLGPEVIRQAQSAGMPIDMFDYNQGVSSTTGPEFNQLANLCDAALNQRGR